MLLHNGIDTSLHGEDEARKTCRGAVKHQKPGLLLNLHAGARQHGSTHGGQQGQGPQNRGLTPPEAQQPQRVTNETASELPRDGAKLEDREAQAAGEQDGRHHVHRTHQSTCVRIPRSLPQRRGATTRGVDDSGERGRHEPDRERNASSGEWGTDRMLSEVGVHPVLCHKEEARNARQADCTRPAHQSRLGCHGRLLAGMLHLRLGRRQLGAIH
mmetsp:Transcript_1916/g.5203  ORF Transcript_1916/g.5203 Transcript_1916/m.5203 type:complete len:214 (-) Transcript_1916:133-774(-)